MHSWKLCFVALILLTGLSPFFLRHLSSFGPYAPSPSAPPLLVLRSIPSSASIPADWQPEAGLMPENIMRWLNVTWANERGDGLPFLVFLHIPKTAGSSIKHIVKEICDRSGEVLGHHERYDFLTFSARKQRLFCGLSAHLGYGIHEQPEWKLPDREVAYITFLRDPISRTISQYNFSSKRLNQSDTTVPLDAWLDKQEHQPFSPWANRNPAVSQLTRFWNSETERGALSFPSSPSRPSSSASNNTSTTTTKDDLLIAKYRLVHDIQVLGLVERYQESIQVMAFKFGAQRISAFRSVQQNNPSTTKAGSKMRVEDLSEEQRRRIVEENRLDVELYEFAVRLFEARYTAMVKAVPARRLNPSRETYEQKKMQKWVKRRNKG
ncbi:Capsular polysaccharide biosynthesis protein WcbF [Balamuthia mandrillaris]